MKQQRTSTGRVIPILLAALVAVSPNLKSTQGNIDCGPNFSEGYSEDPCGAQPCKSDGQCHESTYGKTAPFVPGGLAYGCLMDVKLCGWKFPQQQ